MDLPIVKKTKTDDDGVLMEWDEEKRGWFPKLDDEFIFNYNMKYGFTEESKIATEEARKQFEAESLQNAELYNKMYAAFFDKCKNDGINPQNLQPIEYTNLWNDFYREYQANLVKEAKRELKRKKNAAKTSDPCWFNLEGGKNKHVYVENLPLDINLGEFEEVMSKVGIIMKDAVTHKLRIKLYKDKEDKIKGDGTCCYIKTESVDLALDILDGYNVRGNIIKVTPAKFELKGDFDPKRRRRMTNKEKRLDNKRKAKLFSWGMESMGVRPRNHNSVILKHVFDVNRMKMHPEMRLDLQEKLEKSLRSFEGFKKVKIHELNLEGVVEILMNNANASDIVVAYFNNKTWNGNKLTAELWDGKTRYRVVESEEEAKKRLENWNKEMGNPDEDLEDDDSSDTEFGGDINTDKGDKTPEQQDSGDETPEERDSGEETPEETNSDVEEKKSTCKTLKEINYVTETKRRGMPDDEGQNSTEENEQVEQNKLDY